MFSTWPEDVVKQVAEESRLQDYNSDDVIVRDSSKMHWIVFITKVTTRGVASDLGYQLIMYVFCD